MTTLNPTHYRAIHFAAWRVYARLLYPTQENVAQAIGVSVPQLQYAFQQLNKAWFTPRGKTETPANRSHAPANIDTVTFFADPQHFASMPGYSYTQRGVK